MAEFYYCGTPNDNIVLLRHILQNTDLYLIPDIYYKSKDDLILTREINEYINSIIKPGVMLSFWNEKFYPVFPLSYLVMRSEGYEGLLRFHSSPSLTFSISFFIINEDNSGYKRLAYGCLYHTRELYDEKTHGIIPIPQSLKDEHKKVVKLMKQKLVKVKNKNIWLGKEAYELFIKGELEVIYKGEWTIYDDHP